MTLPGALYELDQIAITQHIPFYLIPALKKVVETVILEYDQLWTLVADRLPEDGQDVLFCDIDGSIMLGYHVKGRPSTHFSERGSWEEIKNVVAWQSLPTPYKGSGDERFEAELLKCYMGIGLTENESQHIVNAIKKELVDDDGT